MSKTMEDIEKEIASIKVVFDKMEKDNEKNLSSEINQLRHYVFFFHELTLSDLHYLLTIALHRVKKPRNIGKLALKMDIASHVLRELDLRPSVDACKGLHLITNKEADIIMNVNIYRNKFSHPEQHRIEYKEFENRERYEVVLLSIYSSFNTVRRAIYRYQKKSPRKAFTLKLLSQRLSKELNKPVEL